MSFNQVLERTWRDNLLFSALVELTYRCNLNCSFCYNDTRLKGLPLTAAQYFRFFEDLRDLGTMNLTLSGGEPLAHPEFFALGSRARELGFVVRIKTNGHALRGRLAQRMRDEVDPFIVETSLHGASAATHDRQTRVPGSFTRLIANLREAQGLGLRLKLNAALTLWNEHEIGPMFALADGLGIPLQVDPQVTGRDDGDLTPLEISPSREGVARLFGLQRERAAAVRTGDAPAPELAAAEDAVAVAGAKHCGAGSSNVIVDPFGNVYPCVQWRRRIGSLHEQSIKSLWEHSDELDQVRRIAASVKEAVDSHDTPGFAFCPGSAEHETGSPVRLYPIAQLLLDLRKRIPVQ